MHYQWRNYDQSILAATDPATGHVAILQPGGPGWAELMESGAAIEPFDPGPTVADLEAERAQMVVSRFQARAALHLAGQLEAVETAIKEGGSVLAKMAWAEALYFRRDSPTIAELAQALELDDETLDAFFRTAAGIKA